MNKCEQLLDDAVAAHDESLADERDKRIALVCETFNRIFPDWPDDCVEADEKGVTLDGGIWLELKLNLTAATSYSYFTYSHRTEGHYGQTCWETVLVASLADLGYAVTLRRVEAEMRELRIARVNKRTRKELDAYEKKGWLERLFSKHPGYGVE